MEDAIEITEEDVRVPILNLVVDNKERVKIKDMADYSDIFYAIESTTLWYWEEYPSMTDREVIDAFNSLIRDFDNQKEGSLASEISKEVKAMLILRKRHENRDYTYGEIISCLSLLIKLAKNHKSLDGKGYLKWIKAFFEDSMPETEEEIIEYIIQNEM